MLDTRKSGVTAYSQLLQDYNLTQMIDSPTHPGIKPTLIDHMVTNTPELVFDVKVITCDISDHDLITAQVKGTRVRRRPVEITVRATRNLCPDALKLDLLLDDWTHMYEAAEPEEKLDKFLEVWNRSINKHMPLKRIRVRHPPCPWLVNNSDLRQKMNERDHARRVKDKHPSAHSREHYRWCRNAVNGHSTLHVPYISRRLSKTDDILPGPTLKSTSWPARNPRKKERSHLNVPASGPTS